MSIKFREIWWQQYVVIIWIKFIYGKCVYTYHLKIYIFIILLLIVFISFCWRSCLYGHGNMFILTMIWKRCVDIAKWYLFYSIICRYDTQKKKSEYLINCSFNVWFLCIFLWNLEYPIAIRCGLSKMINN